MKKNKRKKNIKISEFKGLRTQVFSRYDNGTVVVRDFSDNYWVRTNCHYYDDDSLVKSFNENYCLWSKNVVTGLVY